ncbi:MAG: type II and III secretion system protein family protein [Terriglobia bacterium]|jgi:pilus assembly protein CpaC
MRSVKTSKGHYALFFGITLPMILTGAVLWAQQAPPAQTAQAPQALSGPGEAETLHVLVGRSLVITSPARIRRISVADPTVVDAVAVSPNQILLNGKAPGAVSLVLWDETGQSQEFDVNVDIDIRGLADQFREAFPDQPVKLEVQKDVVILSGPVSSKAVADKMIEMAKVTSAKAVSLLAVPPPVAPGEVLLQVKFAEVDRSALNQLGANLLFPTGKMIGAVGTGQFGPASLQGGILPTPGAGTAVSTSSGATTFTSAGFTLSSLLNIFLYNPQLNIATAIQALQQRNLLQILAEPNLLTESGKEASFISGGEFPFPVVQGGGAGTLPTVTIQFREFGVRLYFTPALTSEGNIHLKVRPEVSSLDYSNALTFSGYTIPALSTRRVESEMELRDGQSFAIAGLVDNRVTEIASKIPGLGDIPILGKFFQSRSLSKSRTELLVLVTPRIVKPLQSSQVPAPPYYPIPFMAPLTGEKPVPPASGQTTPKK